MIKETKTRSVVKTISWRFIAVMNSFLVLTLSSTSSPILNAIYMNITGFIVFYLFERICNKIQKGKYIESD